MTVVAAVTEIAQKAISDNLKRGYLAEDYDGIGSTVQVILSRGSTSSVRASVAAGSFGTEQTFPAGTPVYVLEYNGRLEVVSLGSKLGAGSLTIAMVPPGGFDASGGPTGDTPLIQSGSLGPALFPDTIRPVAVVTTSPTLPDPLYPIGSFIYNTTDKSLKKTEDGLVWIEAIGTTDIQLGSLGPELFASTIRPVSVVTSLPALPDAAYPIGSFIYNSTDKTLKKTDDGLVWIEAIGATDIQANSIVAGNIAAGAIGTSELAAGAVIAGKIAAGTIVAADIAAGTITGSLIAADTIAAGNIAAGAIGASELAANSVIAGKIAAGIIVAADIAAGTITGSQIAADTIAAGNIAAGAIGTSELAANSVIAGKIAAGTIVAADIATGVITTDKLNLDDSYGSTILTAAGWGEAWEDWAQLGLYNATFAKADAAADTVAYWTKVNGSIAWDVIDEINAPGAHALRYPGAGNVASASTWTSEYSPVTGPAIYAAHVYFKSTGANLSPSVNTTITIYWYTAGKLLITTTAASLQITANTEQFLQVGPVGAPTNAHYAKVEIKCQANGAVGSAITVDIYEASLVYAATSSFYIPRGVIWAWYGTHTDIPSGWAICDGTNGTPDLTGRFIVGKATGSPTFGGTINPAGGVLSTHATHTSHSHGVGGGHTHNMGSHTHGVGGGHSHPQTGVNSDTYPSSSYNISNPADTAQYIVGAASHYHSIPATTTGAANAGNTGGPSTNVSDAANAGNTGTESAAQSHAAHEAYQYAAMIYIMKL